MAEQTFSLERFFRTNPKRARLIVVIVCVCIAALVLLISILAAGGEEPLSEEASSQAETISSCPDSPLLEGIPRPNDGTFLSARQTEDTVAVFFEDFPSEALAEFLSETGLTFEGTSPYVAYDDGRTIAVEYDAKEGKLSITVIAD